VALGTLALGAAGTLFVPLAGQTRAREILLPVLLLPLLVPVIIGAVQATMEALTALTSLTALVPDANTGYSLSEGPWMGLLAACAALFLGGGYLLYGQLLGD
jgi:heme exporter protein B